MRRHLGEGGVGSVNSCQGYRCDYPLHVCVCVCARAHAGTTLAVPATLTMPPLPIGNATLKAQASHVRTGISPRAHHSDGTVHQSHEDQSSVESGVSAGADGGGVFDYP